MLHYEHLLHALRPSFSSSFISVPGSGVADGHSIWLGGATSLPPHKWCRCQHGWLCKWPVYLTLMYYTVEFLKIWDFMLFAVDKVVVLGTFSGHPEIVVCSCFNWFHK